jgi:hypothetical protein
MMTPPRRKTAPAGVAIAGKSRDFSWPQSLAEPCRWTRRNDHTTIKMHDIDVAGVEEGVDHH